MLLFHLRREITKNFPNGMLYSSYFMPKYTLYIINLSNINICHRLFGA